MSVLPNGLQGAEYLATSFFSAVAAVFSWLARRKGKQNQERLESIEKQTNGELEKKIGEAIRKAVTHDELVGAVTESAIRDYLDGLLMAHLADDIPINIHDITERRKQHGS